MLHMMHVEHNTTYLKHCSYSGISSVHNSVPALPVT